MVATINMQFSDTVNLLGMYQLFQDLTSTNSTSYTAYKFARDCNNALLDYFMIAGASSGKWQVDDTNQTDYPEIKMNLTANQFDYPLTTDASATANQILEIERVEICVDTSGSSNSFMVLQSYDEMQNKNDSIVYNRGITGVPYRYSKRANGIFLDPTPSYTTTNGLRIYFTRTPTYFLGTDTTKVAGIPHAHQEYLVYRPAYIYAIKNLPQLANQYLFMVNKLEQRIKDYYSRRDRDDRRTITTAPINFM